jgi:hypothetical protein
MWRSRSVIIINNYNTTKNHPEGCVFLGFYGPKEMTFFCFFILVFLTLFCRKAGALYVSVN